MSHFFLFIDNNNVDLNYILTVELGFHFRNLVTLHIQALRQVNQKTNLDAWDTTKDVQ